MIVYLITNTVNNKKYVGITIRTVEKRFRSHINASHNPKWPIHFAIRKYGKSHFIIETIDAATSLEELKEKEKMWISKLNTIHEGYNLTKGGDGCNGYKHSQTHKDYMKIKMLGKNKGKQPRLGKFLINAKSRQPKRQRGETRRKSYIITDPQGITHIIHGLSGFCKQHNLSAGNLVTHGKSKGYLCTKLAINTPVVQENI